METGPLIRLCCTAILLSGPMAHAEDSTPHDLEVKATYILNFTRYATWPDNPGATSPLTLCLAGPNAPSIARQLQQRATGSRPLKLQLVAKVEDADRCNAIYISQSEASQSILLARLRDQAVLTMGDSATFLGEGGMIHMMQADGGVRFEINLEASRHSGVTLNPRLLALAERVVGGGK